MPAREPDGADVSADHGIMGVICIEGKDIGFLNPVESAPGMEPRPGRAATRDVAGLQKRRVADHRPAAACSLISMSPVPGKSRLPCRCSQA